MFCFLAFLLQRMQSPHIQASPQKGEKQCKLLGLYLSERSLEPSETAAHLAHFPGRAAGVCLFGQALVL
jgi:hypothetical protein